MHGSKMQLILKPLSYFPQERKKREEREAREKEEQAKRDQELARQQELENRKRRKEELRNQIPQVRYDNLVSVFVLNPSLVSDQPV